MAAVGFPTGVTLSGNKRWKRGNGRVNVVGKHSKESVEHTVRQRENVLPNHYHRGRCLSTWFLWNAEPPFCWRLLWKQLHFPFFKRYFFLIYLIPPEKSISGPWHWLPLLTLTPDRLSLHIHTCTQAHTHSSPAVWRKTATADRNNSSQPAAAAAGYRHTDRCDSQRDSNGYEHTHTHTGV